MSEKYLDERAANEPRLTLDKLDDIGAMRLISAIEQRKVMMLYHDQDYKTGLCQAHYRLDSIMSRL